MHPANSSRPSTSQHSELRDGTSRLTTLAPNKYVRGQDIIPFHIPHKRLLGSLEIKRNEPEPLPGFTTHQKKRRRDRSAPAEYPFPTEDMIVSLPERYVYQAEETKPHLQNGILNQKEIMQLLRNDPRIGFYYMVYAVPRNHELFSPYNLKIVDYAHIDKDCFMTISAHGVTQHFPNEMIFTPLDQWEKEYDDYCRISKIKLFSKFRLWKAFFMWRKSITRAKYKDAQESIEKNLFFLNPVLQNALLEMREMCLKLLDFNFFDTSCLELNPLFQFIENQMHKKESIQAQLAEYRSQFRHIINSACYEALSEEGFTPHDSNMRLSRIQLLPGQRLPPIKDDKIKMSYTDQARKRRFCSRLTSFIHLVDLLIMDSFHIIIRNSQTSFVEILGRYVVFIPSSDLLEEDDISALLEVPRSPADPQNPMFITDVVCEPRALLLDPSAEVFDAMFNQIIDLWTDALMAIPTFLPDPFFIPFAEPEINGKIEARDCGNGCDLHFCLSTDTVVIETKRESLHLLQKAFQAAETYIQRFQLMREFYNANLAISGDDLSKNRSLEVFRKNLSEFSRQEEELERCVDSQPLGLLLVKFDRLKEEVLPSSRNLRGIIEDVMPCIGREKVQVLLEEIEEKQLYIDRDPVLTKEFVEYLEFLESITKRVEEMDCDLDYCKELYDLCDEYGIPVPEQDSEEYYRLGEWLGTLRRTVDRKLSDKLSLVAKFVAQCQVDINALLEDTMKTHEMVMDKKFVDSEANLEDIRASLDEVSEKVHEYQERANEIKGYQKSYRVEVTRFEMLDALTSELRVRQLLWDSLEEWKKSNHLWMLSDFSSLDPDDMMQFTNKNLKNVQQMEKLLPENFIVPQFKSEVQDIKEKLPTITSLRNPNLKARHWANIEQLMNVKISPDEPVSLQYLLEKGLMNFTEQLNDIAAQASSEAALEGLLHKVENAWQEAELIVLNHRDQKDVFILGGLEDTFTLLEESMININTILSSRHVGPIKSRVEDWLDQLQLFSKTLDEWIQCQQSWLYLESIFSAPDIQRQLPAEAKMFIAVDKSWKDVMRRTAKTPLAMSACTYPGLYETFVNNNALLDQVMKCLEAYLESKRVVFPRFYFLSNDELIEILAQTRNPHAVQPHLRKCFDAISRLEFGKGGVPGMVDSEDTDKLSSDIVAMISPEGERVVLSKGLKARGNVEDWLTKVEESMFTSLRRIMKAALASYSNFPMDVWVLNQPSQIVLTISQVMWTHAVEKILENKSTALIKMQEFEKKNFTDLNLLAGMVRGELTKLSRAVLCALITINVHARDNISALVKSQISERSSFEWLKQLRYYWDVDIDNCVARMSTSYYVYGYEYLGASPRLVITPLTDRCYLCLMGALQLDLGGAPAGPAGTGKTETTKDLAKSLAIQCVVFNCSEGLDYKMMGRFFSGLAQSGAWCCFDEFNRIDIEVLSVIAQQIITIRNAKAAKLARFMFEGREIKLVQQCAAFITMNPGYAGRTELPDNLKALFRPISMMVPDYGLIAEVILYSEGFESSKPLAKKMVQMYKLCSEQLSQQDHYDFGMRAVKSVLVMAGSLKRANPDVNENIVLIRALRDSNLPKFLSNDALLFQGILKDLFPGIEIPEQDYGHLQDAIVSVMLASNLQPIESMISKVIQLYETCIVRHGVMLVGPTGGGKTTIIKTLGNTLGELHKMGIKDPQFFPVHYYIMNPKSITMGELYGEVNPLTMEWRDGLLGISVRTAVQSTNTDHQWVVCDGPVDAVWIENMNTVLDDNKMLCLANSERIKLTEFVTMMFEVQDLAQASPATVSRCGMVYIDPNDLKWMPYVKSWLSKLTIIPEDLQEFVLDLFKRSVDRIFKHILDHCDQGIPQVDMGKVQALCALYEALILEPGASDLRTDDKLRFKNFLCQAFVFSAVWSLGGNVSESGRDSLDICVREIFDDHPDARLPTSGDIWSLYINVSTRRLEPWSKIMPSFHYDPQIPFFDLLVPTQDTVCFSYLLEKLMTVNKPVLYIGGTGVGKSVIAKSALSNLASTNEYVPVTLNFSAQTNSFRTQEILEMHLEKRKKNLLGAPLGKKVVVFIDDVNMPKLEIYGAQPPIELLRQYLDFHGLYDREKLFWKEVKDVIITAACAPPGGGRNPLTPRFVRHFTVLHIPKPSEGSLKVIFKSILRGFLSDFVKPVQDIADAVVNASIDIYQRIMEDLLPTPTKSHYVFNLRDLSKCIQGVLQADSGSLREVNDLLRLFSHECLRVFHDRLVNMEDKSYFYKLLAEVNTKLFGNPILELPSEDEVLKPPTILFGDFMHQSTPHDERIYEEIKDTTKLQNILQDYLDEYNLSAAREMKLILFMDAVEHVLRVARILRSERGNGLLVGVGGMGKRSLTILGAHLNGYKCFQIELARNYNHESFFEDLRKLYFNAGAKNEATVFLFNDTQVVEEEFLEDINNILNSGEVPGLFESDELEKVIQAVRPAAKDAGIMEHNRDAIFNFFISRVRSKLHLVLCMSPVGDSFRRRCRMFPSLVNCCTIDWFSVWPQEALQSVALNSLKGHIEEGQLESYANICVLIHESVGEMSERFYVEMRRHYYTTPSSYLELIKLFLSLLEKKRKETRGQRDRIANGLQKLYETNDLVAQMKVELSLLGPILKEKSDATNKLMEKLVKEQAQAMEVRQVVEADEAVAKVKADETQAIADDAQADLDQALPAMEAATKALEALNKNDINELKVFNKPPPLVRTVMEAVCLLLGQKTDWTTAKVVLADTNFLKKLQEYDKDHIPDMTLRKLKAYIDNKDFMPDVVATQSKVCKSICLWVRAIDTYSKVYKIVEPKKKRLEQAERELATVMAVLQEKQQKLADVEATIAKLEATYDASLSEKIELEDSIALTSARLARSASLTAALGDEQVRWESSVQILSEELQNMTGNVLVAAAYLSYLGAFTAIYRRDLIQIWLQRCITLNIPASSTFNLISVLADPYDIRLWNSFGLPRDKISTENAILVTQAGRWPLMIDPQEQANRWIRKMEAKQNLKVIRLTDSNLLQTLESAIRLGSPVLLEELGEALDPALTPILLRQTYTKSGRLLIRFADSEIDYDTNFRLYLTTKMANPHYLPEICIQVTLVNFTVTLSGLEDQLLAEVVRLERPDLESQRTDLITRINADKQQLKNIEDKILQLLFHSTGNILDDEELIETLNESKETSAIISTRLEEAEATEEKISIAREKYRPVAARGSCLYFVVAQLGDIDPMYQYSLKYFKMVFNTVIETSKKVPDLNQRLKILLTETTSAVYSTVSRGLFEKHKLVFSFLLCTSIQLQANSITEPQWNFLLRGFAGRQNEEETIKPENLRISDNCWKSVQHLAKEFPYFSELPTDLNSLLTVSVGDFHVDIKIGENHSKKDWNGTLDDFSKIMMIKALKPEKLVFAITEYVKKKLGQAFVESPQVNLSVLYQDTNNITPLIFILSTGSDPFGSFQRFAHEMGTRDKVQAISLGQGQGPIAEKMIRSASLRGDWVFLQNCHLAASWMLPLERLVQSLAEAPDKVHNDFRLFLSSSPCQAFPVSVLQNSIKVTNEPPKGLRANIKRAFLEITEDFFEDNPLGANWRKMIFGVCIFQAVIQERKKFGPLGWNIIYDFSDSDRECALLNLKLFCSEGYIPWDALEYITGEITYGGRVTDNWDQRCLSTILKCFFSEKTLEPGYKFSPSGIYYCPDSEQCKSLVAYRNFINKLPIIDEPEVFGMHENANIAFELNESDTILQTIRSVQPQESDGSNATSSDDIALDLSKSIALRIVEKIDPDVIHPSLTKKDDEGRLPSLTIVLLQEIERFNKLLLVLHLSLSNLNSAIKGFVVMSESLEEVYKAFINNQVPKLWARAAYPSLKSLSSWIIDLELRLDFIKSWLTTGPPQSFWLSGFFFPQGFLTGVLQTHARKYTLAIDELVFDFKVDSILIQQHEVEQDRKSKGEVKNIYKGLQQPPDGIFIHGLFLEAARWDYETKLLADPNPGEINPPLPAVHLVPCASDINLSNRYRAPLYKTSARAGVLSTTGHSTNFIMAVLLPTNLTEDVWITRGCALLRSEMALPPAFLERVRLQAGRGAEYPEDAAPELRDGDRFDVVVVGAGASGAVVAARLAAARPDWRVLAMETGGDPPPEAEVPGLWHRLWQPEKGLIYTYRSEPRRDAFQGMRGNSTFMIRGKALGGTSTVNAMPYLRGHPADYDAWGVEGWCFKDVLPFFKRSEDMRAEGEPELHGEGGELTVEAAAGDRADPLKAVLRGAVRELGLAEVADLSGPGPGPLGWGDPPRTQRDGLRCGSAKAFLSRASPAGGAPNLRVARRCTATRLRFAEDGRVEAVEAVVGAERAPVAVSVGREVVLAAGAMETPKLLLLSGVGPGADLKALGLPVVKDLPVGECLQDHAQFPGLVFTVPPARPETADPLTAFLEERRGPLSNVGLIELMGFTHTPSTKGRAAPSVLFNHVRYPKGMFQNKALAPEVEQAIKSINQDSDVLMVIPFLLHPGRPGRLGLRTADPADPPRFDSGLLADPRDVDILVEGVRLVERMAQTKSFKDAGVTLRYLELPGGEGDEAGSTRYWERLVRHLAGSAFHPVATCPLGSVLDGRLRVRGVRGVRVGDASALPTPVSANPNAPAVMVGERAAQFILEDHEGK
ncbi:Dynein heavy chain 6, axonemal [Frankliniella fusca]|uniref:Dynein heavy chain 6, axonemal n=1 Tax=Frankliniella fusca TaxID=407009 RepID=A0AAE1LTJ1_9NEOP|nr:Dynein heavy chain 6, axonemal [Frankliniella fusca]